MKIIKTSNDQNATFEVNKITYKMELRTQNPSIKRQLIEGERDNDNKSTITLASYKSFDKDNASSVIEFDDKVSINNGKECYDKSSIDTKKMEKKKFAIRLIKDTIKGKPYHFEIYYSNNEIDGNLIAKEDIDLNKGLGDIIYYPKIGHSIKKERYSTETYVDSVKKEEETKKIEESKNTEEKSMIKEGELTKIKKDSKIIIEVKQNTTLEIIFQQMEKLINNFTILFPDEKYYYLGFLNYVNAKNNLDEKKFIERVKECEKKYTNYKIFIFLINNNTILDLDLRDQANYPVYFRNEIKKEIKELKNKIGDLTTEIGNIKTDVDILKTDVDILKTDVDILKTDMSSLRTDMSSLRTDMSSLRTDIDSLKADNKSLREEMNAQFKSLRDMFINFMSGKKAENDDKNTK